VTEAFSLLSGPDPASVTARALRWADERAGDGPDSVLCLTQSKQRANELKGRWREANDPLRFTATTLDEYVGRRYERATGSSSRSKLAKPDRLRLVEAAIERFEADSGPFSDVQRPSNDLVDQVQGVFSLLEYAGYSSPDAIEHALHCAGTIGDDGIDPELHGSFRNEEPDTLDGGLADQASTVSGLYSAYQDLRDEVHPSWTVETPEQYSELLDQERLVETVSADLDAVLLDGLTRLAPAEREAVARIARNRPTVAVVPLVHDSMSGTGTDLGVKRALQVFLSIGFTLDYRTPTSTDHDRIDVVRRLQTPTHGDSTYPPSDVGIEWLEPSTEREEVRTTARRVRKLLSGDNVSPADIGIVVTDRSTYRGILSETLTGYEIPFTFTNDIGIEQTLVGDALESLLDLADDDPTGRSLAALCSNVFVSSSELDIEESTIISAREKAATDSLREIIEELEAAEATETVDAIRGLLDAVVPADDSLAEYARALREMLSRLGVEEAVDGYGSPDDPSGSHRPAYEKSAWSSIEDVLSTLETIAPALPDGDQPGRVRRALRAELVSGPDQRDGYVRVLPLAEAEMASFDHLFVLGLTSGYFPSEQDTMAFFGAINDADEEFSRAQTGRRARYILGTLLTGSGNVVLSTPRHTVDGTEHVPAAVVSELRESVRAPGGSADPSDRAPIVSAEDVQREFAMWAGGQQFDSPVRAADGLNGTDALSDDARAFAIQGLHTAWRRSRPELTTHDAQIEEVLDDVFPVWRRGPYSPSALEDYARCPFVFLSKQVLGFEADYGEENDIGRADRGTYVHDVLAEFYRELRADTHVPVDLNRFDEGRLEDALLQAALDRLETLGDEETPFARRTVTRLLAGLGSPVDNPYFGTHDGDGVRGLFARFLDEELDAHESAQARATYFEAAINLDYEDVELLQDGPVSVDTPHGQVEVHGIADRVDVVDGDSRGIHVRDYKTGSTPSRKDVTLGTKLQLPIYGLVLESVLEAETGISHEMLGGSYYRLKSPDDVGPLTGNVSSREAVDDEAGTPLLPPPSQPWRLPFDSRREFTRLVRDVTPVRLGEIASGIENGAFHPTLLSEDLANCEDCSFRDACDVRHHHQQETIAGLDETRHYVSERALDVELDLDAYASLGDD
jgi:ATP-dependent helicase/nuclease subunit B